MPSFPTDAETAATDEQERLHQELLNGLQHERTLTATRPVYHYTGDIGLYEILKSGHLWLSDYTTLNDPTELTYGVNVGVEVLNAAVVAQGNLPKHLLFIQGFQSVLARGIHSILRGYVLSLSVEGDELTQWRSYANSGAGYCLGFDSVDLDKALGAFGAALGHLGYGSFEVLYDEPFLRNRMGNHVAISLSALSQIARPTAVQLQRLGVDLLFAMIYTALYFKHPAYKSEQEYRILLLASAYSASFAATLTRARNNQIVDYLAMDWKSSFATALQSITIGPAGNTQEATAFVNTATTMHLLPSPKVIVRKSGIPFRR